MLYYLIAKLFMWKHSGKMQGSKLTSVLGGQRASFLDFLVVQNKIKWPWISTCTYMNVPVADFIRILT